MSSNVRNLFEDFYSPIEAIRDYSKPPDSSDDCETLVELYASQPQHFPSSSSSSSSSDDEDPEYYKELDKAMEIECQTVEFTDQDQEVLEKGAVSVDPTRTSSREIFMTMQKDLCDVKELLKWELPTNTENRIILKPIDRKKNKERFAIDSIATYEMVLDKFEKKAKEEELRMLRGTSESAHKYIRTLDRREHVDVEEETTISNVLTLSKSYPVFEQRGEEILGVSQEGIVEEKEEINSITVSNSISNLREDMRAFNRQVEALTSMYDKKYDELMRTYNEYWREYVKSQEKGGGESKGDSYVERLLNSDESDEETPVENERNKEDIKETIGMEKIEETKIEEPKIEEKKIEEKKIEEKKIEETKIKETKIEETKIEETNTIDEEYEIVERNLSCTLEMQLASGGCEKN